MNQQTVIVLITLVIYNLVLVGVGIWASKRNRNESDFFVASQGLGAWVAGLSYAASTSSAWVLLGCLAGYFWQAESVRERQTA